MSESNRRASNTILTLVDYYTHELAAESKRADTAEAGLAATEKRCELALRELEGQVAALARERAIVELLMDNEELIAGEDNEMAVRMLRSMPAAEFEKWQK